jgi:hypothetical protein
MILPEIDIPGIKLKESFQKKDIFSRDFYDLIYGFNPFPKGVNPYRKGILEQPVKKFLTWFC